MMKIINIILKNWKYISFVLPYFTKFFYKLKNKNKMEDLRDGFFTEKQEKKIDELIELNGISEKFDGVAIRLLDNKGLEALKPKLIEKWGPEVLPDIYEVIDLLFESLEAITKD